MPLAALPRTPGHWCDGCSCRLGSSMTTDRSRTHPKCRIEIVVEKDMDEQIEQLRAAIDHDVELSQRGIRAVMAHPQILGQPHIYEIYLEHDQSPITFFKPRLRWIFSPLNAWYIILTALSIPLNIVSIYLQLAARLVSYRWKLAASPVEGMAISANRLWFGPPPGIAGVFEPSQVRRVGFYRDALLIVTYRAKYVVRNVDRYWLYVTLAHFAPNAALRPAICPPSGLGSAQVPEIDSWRQPRNGRKALMANPSRARRFRRPITVQSALGVLLLAAGVLGILWLMVFANDYMVGLQ